MIKILCASNYKSNSLRANYRKWLLLNYYTSKYINNNVVKTLNCFEETLHERIDAVAIVIEVDDE